jgi:hypothetical protein
MDLQTNTFTSSSQGLRSHRSRTKLPSRQANNDLKLHRQGSQTKLDKRRSGGEHLNEYTPFTPIPTLKEEKASQSSRLAKGV